MMKNDPFTPLISPYEFESTSKKNQILAVCGATMALLATGNAAGFSAVALPSFVESMEATKDELSWIASMVTVGCITGNFMGGLIADLIGRKKTMMFASFIFAVGWVVIAESPNVPTILAGRILTGWAAGLLASPVQVYICEIADPSIRGASGSAPSLTVTFGILFMYCLGSVLEWRLVALISSLFPLLVLLYIFLVLPESPTYLVAKGLEREAMKSLSWLRNSNEKSLDEFIALQDLQEARLLSQNVSATRSVPKFLQSCPFYRFREPAVLKPFFIGATLFFFQAFSGIFSITCYTTLIFRYADHFLNDYVQTICVGLMRMCSVVAAIFLVNCAKRRTLLILSALVMCFANGVLGSYFYMRESAEKELLANLTYGMTFPSSFVQDSTLAFHDFEVMVTIGQLSMSLEWIPTISLVVFMLGYSIGYGVIPYFLMAELLASDVRSLGCSIAFAFGQICLFASVKSFLDLVELVGADGTFLIYSSVSLISILFVIIFVPETSNLSDQEIAEIFRKNKKSRR